MLTIEPIIVNKYLSQRMSILRSTPNHTPLKYKCLNKIKVHITLVKNMIPQKIVNNIISKNTLGKLTQLHCLWHLVSRTLFAKGLNWMPRIPKESRPTIANMILFANISKKKLSEMWSKLWQLI